MQHDTLIARDFKREWYKGVACSILTRLVSNGDARRGVGCGGGWQRSVYGAVDGGWGGVDCGESTHNDVVAQRDAESNLIEIIIGKTPVR